MQAFFSMILTLVMWIKAPSLGTVPQCNAKLKFIFLFAVDVDATTTGRIIGLICTSTITLLFMATTIPEMLLSARLRKSIKNIRCIPILEVFRKRKGGDGQSKNIPESNEKTVMGRIATFNGSPLTEEPGAYAISPTDSSSVESHRKKSSTGTFSTRPRPSFYSAARSATISSHLSKEAIGRRRWVHALDGTLIGTVIFQLIVFAYFISVNELYILRNPTDSGNNIWGFGQVYTLYLTFTFSLTAIRYSLSSS